MLINSNRLQAETPIESLGASLSASPDGVSTTSDVPGGVVIEGDCEIAGQIRVLGWSSVGVSAGAGIALSSEDTGL